MWQGTQHLVVKFKRVAVATAIFRGFFTVAPRGQYFRRRWKILIPFGGTLRGTPGRLCYTAGSDPTVPQARPRTPRSLSTRIRPLAPRRPPTLVTPAATPFYSAPRRAAPHRTTPRRAEPPPPCRRCRPLEPAELTIPLLTTLNHPQPPNSHPRALPLPSTALLCEPLVNLLAPL